MPPKIIHDGLVLAGIAAVLAVTEPATPRAERWPAPVAYAGAIEPSNTSPSLAPTVHPPVARDLATLSLRWKLGEGLERRDRSDASLGVGTNTLDKSTTIRMINVKV